jgi:hypothetical protein
MEITAQTRFELSDDLSAKTATGVLGIWRVGPSAPSVAFTASHPTAPEALLWRIDLPADPRQAAGRLEAGHARLRTASDRLADATARLDAALDRSGPGVAFTAETPLAGTFTDSELDGWQRLVSCCRPSALVETRIQDQPVARSLLGLGGNLRTVCRTGLGPRHAGLHREGVRLVVDSRAAVLRVIACVTRGAVAISVRLALPGGAVLALPVAWRFVQRVLAEVDRGRTGSP